MRKIITLLLITAIGALSGFQCKRDKLIPVTTSSEKAKILFDQATEAYDDAYYDMATDLFIKALEEDPDFFMANYELATYCLYSKEEKSFREYGKRAEKCQDMLSEGEIIMKDAISRLLKKSDSDVTDLGKKLVKLYPHDIRAYNQLNFYQLIIKDFKGQEETMRKSLEVAVNKAPVYNRLGYTYMNLGRNEDALASFDKYIELEPYLPNPYDSKGDYYMFVKDYRNAYENFMKANAIDSTWSMSKAMNAKTIADTLGM